MRPDQRNHRQRPILALNTKSVGQTHVLFALINGYKRGLIAAFDNHCCHLHNKHVFEAEVRTLGHQPSLPGTRFICVRRVLTVGGDMYGRVAGEGE